MSIKSRYEFEKLRAIGGIVRKALDAMAAAVWPGVATAELDRMEVRQALTAIGRSITGRACDPQAAALFRIVATEAQRFPALAEKMRIATKDRIESAVAQYFHGQITRGRLTLTDPERAAALFTHMLKAELQECMLFGSIQDVARLDFPSHIDLVVEIFLNGAAPRGPGRGV